MQSRTYIWAGGWSRYHDAAIERYTGIHPLLCITNINDDIADSDVIHDINTSQSLAVIKAMWCNMGLDYTQISQVAMTADSLRALRAAKDMTQLDLATATGISVRQIVRYEAGEAVIPRVVALACRAV